MFSQLNLEKRKEKERQKKEGQVLLEFTFCMIVLFFMVYGVIMVFRWTGVDLAERRRAHNQILHTGITKDWTNLHEGPLAQIRPHFYDVTPMNATQAPY